MAIVKMGADSVLDGALNTIKSNATELYVIVGPNNPADRAGAIAMALASKTGLTSADYTGPADGDTSGRKLTVNAQSGLSVTATGTAVGLALCSASTLYYVTTTTSQALTAGGSVNVPAWQISFADPT